MNNKEIIISHLRSMGFELTEVDNFGYVFSYEELNFLYMPDDDDEEFLRIVLPNIYEVNDDNRNEVLETMQQISMMLKYSKPCIMYDTSVWAVYEHFLTSTDNIEDVIEHILQVLHATAIVFHKKIEGEEIITSTDDVDAELEEALANVDDKEK